MLVAIDQTRNCRSNVPDQYATTWSNREFRQVRRPAEVSATRCRWFRTAPLQVARRIEGSNWLYLAKRLAIQSIHQPATCLNQRNLQANKRGPGNGLAAFSFRPGHRNFNS